MNRTLNSTELVFPKPILSRKIEVLRTKDVPLLVVIAHIFQKKSRRKTSNSSIEVVSSLYGVKSILKATKTDLIHQSSSTKWTVTTIYPLKIPNDHASVAMLAFPGIFCRKSRRFIRLLYYIPKIRLLIVMHVGKLSWILNRGRSLKNSVFQAHEKGSEELIAQW